MIHPSLCNVFDCWRCRVGLAEDCLELCTRRCLAVVLAHKVIDSTEQVTPFCNCCDGSALVDRVIPFCLT